MNDIGIILICLISFPFILFILRIIILSWKYCLLSRQLKAMEQQSARQQAESAGNSNTTATVGGESSCQMETTKVADYPPAYDDIIQASSEVKVPIQDNATSAAGNQIVDNANAISTITIETDTPSNVANNNVSEKSKDPSIV